MSVCVRNCDSSSHPLYSKSRESVMALTWVCPRGLIGGFLEMRVMAGGVSSVGKVEVFGLVKGLVDG